MNKIRSRAYRVAAGLALMSAMAASGLTAQAATASVPVDLRVVSNEAGNLVDVRQYVPLTGSVKTYAGDDCFDTTPPIKQSSGTMYPQASPTMLAAVAEASQFKTELQPFRVSDADYSSFGALSVCQVGAKTPPGFFFLKANHQALQVGADLFTVNPGEDVLIYRTPEDFTADEELELTAPTRTAPGVPITVNVRSYTATLGPRDKATVLGGDTPAVTNAGGNAFVTFSAPGRYTLYAGGDYNDIPSQPLSVCVAPDPLTECPAERGREIIGSDEPEGIRGTDGEDVIRPRSGDDVVKAREGNDRIISQGGGKDVVNCGDGRDQVTRDFTDRVAKNCEKVLGKKLKKGAGKKKGGSKKGGQSK